MDTVMTVCWFVGALVVFVLGADLGSTAGIRLPTPWPNVSALLVMTVAGAASYGLLELGSMLEYPRARLAMGYQGSWSDVEEPDEEFWSVDMLEGWRAWRWEDGLLHGVYDRWRTTEYEATCEQCRDVPAWGHACGIYAVKSPTHVHRFHNSAQVIGRVEMWGSVIEHEKGYRSSNARITDLWVDNESMAQAIRRRYSVAVHVGSPNGRKEKSWRT